MIFEINLLFYFIDLHLCVYNDSCRQFCKNFSKLYRLDELKVLCTLVKLGKLRELVKLSRLSRLSGLVK